MNPLRVIFEERSINVSAFARSIGVPRQSVYTALKETSKVWRTSVDLFIAIAHGLGMSADELYEEMKNREHSGESDD